MATKKTSIGGQALIEGIMMRGPKKTAMAVRNTKTNEIILEEYPTKGANRMKLLKLPFIRGIFNMIDSLSFGYKCLMRSAELSGLEDEEEEKKKAKGPSVWDRLFEKLMMPIATVLAVALALGLFVYLPMKLWQWITFSAPKTIFCYEKGLPLTVENVRPQTRFHPRCGTSFMILMLIVGIIISMFIRVDNLLLRTGLKLLTFPIVVGIGYELIKLAGRRDNVCTRVIAAPGKWLQRLTTREPDDSMIECAIAAMEKVIPEDGSDNW